MRNLRTYNEQTGAIYTEFVNADVFEVFPSDACHLFYTAEAFPQQVVQVEVETQHAQPFLYGHLHNRITHTHTQNVP